MANAVLFLESSKNMGGQEWQLLQQMQCLQNQGVKVLLLCSSKARISQQAQQLGLQTLHLPFRNSVHVPTIMGIVKVIKQWQPKACICHSGHDANNLSVAALFLGRKRPKIIRSRTYYTNSKPKKWQRLLPLDVVMVPSRFMQKHVQKQFQSKPVQVVYPGIDFDKLDAQKNADLPQSLQAFLNQHRHAQVLVQVGMLRPEKGQETTLQALANMRSQGRNVVAVLAGGGNAQPIEQCMHDLGLQDCVWVGEVKPIAPLLMQANVLSMPSRKEPLGMVQIEALGLGVPVVVSDVDGIPETVTHNQTGLLVDADDVLAWQKALEHALDEPQLMQQYAKAGQLDVRQRFGAEKNTAQLQALIFE